MSLCPVPSASGRGGGGSHIAACIPSGFLHYSMSSKQTHYLGLKAQIVCEDASDVSEAAEVEETSIPGSEWRVTEAVEVVEVKETSIPGAGWRAMETAEVAKVTEMTAPMSDHEKKLEGWLYV
ncbi:hypothetical protein B0H17DRAFT_1150821 [Mycena rosella]|uniref:Uncharacterized protein n=1 Tax=Mycena rosella TaxID=1033263 RepID=A0AAD7BQS7_MYCRO|nr:hypothetical protein B0H17DRAFT_1150821 [Mycena rosella]